MTNPNDRPVSYHQLPVPTTALSLFFCAVIIGIMIFGLVVWA